MSSLDVEESHVPDQLVDQLAKGYDALFNEIKCMDEYTRQLENKLSWAKQQYLDALKRLSPETASKEFQCFLGELDEAGSTKKHGNMGWLESMSQNSNAERRDRAFIIQRAIDARGKIDYRKRASESGAVKIWKNSGACAMEQDFTTSGIPGKLGCPFSNKGTTTPRSSISRNSLGGWSRRSRRSFHDPIKVEKVPEPSIEGSIPLCPIRFLDQHSPEEVATFFEQHKHEIPRSHEICIKRFQENEDALKSLDSKYSNMVAMVKDLGKMHQSMLPNPTDEDDSASKIAKWAETVDENAVEEVVETQPDTAERQQRFDRTSLKDVRLGESPSRPWGIKVPEDITSKHSDPQPHGTDVKVEAVSKGGCPFSGKMAQSKVSHAQEFDEHPISMPVPKSIAMAVPMSMHIPSQVPQSTTKVQSLDGDVSSSRMVFNGPVFFGYSVEEAMKMMERLNSG